MIEMLVQPLFARVWLIWNHRAPVALVQTGFFSLSTQKKGFNLVPNKHLLLCVCSTSLLKTQKTCNEQFLLFPSVFYPF